MTTRTRITHDEYQALIARPEYAERRLELIDGEIVEKPMPTEEHGDIAGWIATFFNLYFMSQPIGRTIVEGRYRPTDDQDNELLPDVAVVIGVRPLTRRGAANFIPDICVEIQSPDQPLKALREKARFYLEHGAKYALVVRPDRRMIEVYSADEEIAILRAADALTFPDLLPGFTVEVGRLFPPADQLVDGDDA